MSVNIYVATHKNYTYFPQEYPYKVMQVNAKINGHKGFASLYDDSGENISEKNANYCELSALYWLWKNHLTAEYIGLTHYRRYFCFSPTKKFWYEKLVINPNDTAAIKRNIGITDAEIEKIFVGCDIILPCAHYCKSGLRLDYYEKHIKGDFLVLEKTVKELYPDYTDSFDKVMNGYKLYCYNMFITNHVLFIRYMEWLFNILFNVEKKINISSDCYQKRVFGFMAERLCTLYVYHNKLKILELPIVYLDENVTTPNWQRKSGHTILSDLGIISWY